MRKTILFLMVFILPLISGCSNEIEDDKYAYLEYKSDLEEKETFNDEDEIDFNSYFNIERDNEVVNYSMIIDGPKVNMHNIKALLIHDYRQEGAFPSVGILDDERELLKGSPDKIILSGKIQTMDDVSDVTFKLYLEYTTDDGNVNKVYYKVSRG